VWWGWRDPGPVKNLRSIHPKSLPQELYNIVQHNHSQPLSRPAISHGQIYFSAASFEFFGRGHGHLATLPLTFVQPGGRRSNTCCLRPSQSGKCRCPTQRRTSGWRACTRAWCRGWASRSPWAGTCTAGPPPVPGTGRSASPKTAHRNP